jgi:hypothetical protein
MLIQSRLWMPQHPLADFFESFHLLVKPVYASKYFPGTALLFAPGLAMELPYWLLPAITAGAVVGLTYLIIAEMTNGVGGLLAALMLIANSSLRRASVLYISAVPLLLLVLLGVWAYLHWRRERHARWAAAVGFFMSWAAITRPLDALCFAIPIGVAVLIDLRHVNARGWIVSLGALAIAAIPVVALQLVANVGITGKWHQTPWTAYTRSDDPCDGLAIGELDANLKSASTLPQKIEFSEHFTNAAATERRAPGRVSRFFNDDLPADVKVILAHPLLIILIPVGLLAIRGRSRGVLLATIPLSLFAYSLYAFSVPHYLVIAAPAGALAVILGIEATRSCWPVRRGFIEVFLTLSIVGVVCTQLPQLNRFILDDMFRPTEPRQIADALARLPQTPAVVLFHFTPGADNIHIEPVYNTDVARIDDAPVIRAHDLGDRNIEIFRHYPDRAFYLCKPRNSGPKFLGIGRDLAARATTTPSGL